MCGMFGNSNYIWFGKLISEVMINVLMKLMEIDFGSSESFGNMMVKVYRFDGSIVVIVIVEMVVVGIFN